jgi:hypothetical protein
MAAQAESMQAMPSSLGNPDSAVRAIRTWMTEG